MDFNTSAWGGDNIRGCCWLLAWHFQPAFFNSRTLQTWNSDCVMCAVLIVRSHVSRTYCTYGIRQILCTTVYTLLRNADSNSHVTQFWGFSCLQNDGILIIYHITPFRAVYWNNYTLVEAPENKCKEQQFWMNQSGLNLTVTKTTKSLWG